jgi:hypothetical protein
MVAILLNMNSQAKTEQSTVTRFRNRCHPVKEKGVKSLGETNLKLFRQFYTT